MRKKLKLLTLAIPCALLYDGCKPDDPLPNTILYGKIVDLVTDEPIPNVPFEISVDIGGATFGGNYRTVDTLWSDNEGKFRGEYSSFPYKGVIKTSIFVANTTGFFYHANPDTVALLNVWLKKYKRIEGIEPVGVCCYAKVNTTQQFLFVGYNP